MTNDGGVVYTVKELIGMLERSILDQISVIDRKMDAINDKLDGKASNLRADSLEMRVRVNEDRLSKLELIAAGTAAATRVQRAVFGAAIVLVGGGIGELIYLAATAGRP